MIPRVPPWVHVPQVGNLWLRGLKRDMAEEHKSEKECYGLYSGCALNQHYSKIWWSMRALKMDCWMRSRWLNAFLFFRFKRRRKCEPVSPEDPQGRQPPPTFWNQVLFHIYTSRPL
ncbi:hypothetical protein AVEN_114441-1 [Araneus ventricosus]|uniref:Uncharacterized protein n=1 Tax=Araneus ventricosus TaxID=182803 RepID=A0A4Y2IH99_ARAVE|nr:hypothetical protein AVEN_114441-1 [Araneus ventricosus]